MKAIKNNHFLVKLFNKSIFSLIYYTILFLVQYIQNKKKIRKVYFSKDFKIVLEKYLNTKIKIDNISRLYCIINPNLDIEGNIDYNNIILDFNDEETSSEQYVLKYINTQLELIKSLFKLENLYNYITLSIKHVGPLSMDNYLIVFNIVPQQYLIKYASRLFDRFILYSLIISLLFIFI